jgi:tRNA pseudouridine38-40 synthase
VRGGLEAREARLAGDLGRVPPYRITLAYDGTDFQGFQAQRAGARTVQAELEKALGRLAAGQRVAVAGAGRTDSGVHALGQVASFDLPRDIAPDELRRALNGLLPDDVRVLEADRAPAGFHARRSARSKLYRYVLDAGGVALPQRRRIAGYVPWVLDETRAREAASLFVGRHDFASLASAGGSVKTTVRTVTRSEATFVARREGAGERSLVYEVEADGFLRRMVRSQVGGLVAVGRGVVSVDELARALAACDRGAWPPPAPAAGLTLVRVDYPPPAGPVLT